MSKLDHGRWMYEHKTYTLERFVASDLVGMSTWLLLDYASTDCVCRSTHNCPMRNLTAISISLIFC